MPQISAKKVQDETRLGEEDDSLGIMQKLKFDYTSGICTT